MWNEYLEKANLYKGLADYYKYRNSKLYHEYKRKYYEYTKKFVAAYEKEKGVKPPKPPFPPYPSSYFFLNRAQVSHEPVNIRLLHASVNEQKTPVDVYIDGQLLARSLPYGVATRYLRLPAGEKRFDLYPAGRKGTRPLLRQTAVLEREKNYLIALVDSEVAYPWNLRLLPYPEYPAQMSGEAGVRFIHLAEGGPVLDLSLRDGTVLFPDVTYQEVMEYFALPPVRTRLLIRQAKTDGVLATTPDVHFRPGKAYTIIAICPNRQMSALVLRDQSLRR
ncbi:DUF4397 domain-containing protein [Paenactinomyces guangxiensis]|uniref:DUF4397 domain-containing protein n=1 Tax=Paenactinomyces guangxiensis TaxID=1490290 RepID=A0A7W2A7R5_9BACL|nr:DUF4397 domain-containing protein [Paenactinomyces guangxiensis]MBA4493880.1 DUF4397 domain-containing protein [Paenactinomyces guangxiensis]MBH8591346.1 DUF4397 domain-containing protein [Paenactinomyces guangxiensis]